MSARDFDEALADAANHGRYPTGLARRPQDLTITQAHRTCLRRILRGEPVGDLGGVLGALYLHELVDDAAVGVIVLTPAGKAVLDAHDAATEERWTPEDAG